MLDDPFERSEYGVYKSRNKRVRAMPKKTDEEKRRARNLYQKIRRAEIKNATALMPAEPEPKPKRESRPRMTVYKGPKF